MGKNNILKRLCIIVITLSVAICSLALASCGQADESSITVENNQIVLELNQEEKINVSLVGFDISDVAFSSSNESVVSVNGEGIIKANGVGSATVTASVGGKSAECAVTVNIGKVNPTFTFSDVLIYDGKAIIDLSDKINLKGIVDYENSAYTDYSVAYEVADKNIGNVVDDEFVPLKKGETTIKVTVTWKNYNCAELNAVLSVKVLNSIEFYVNDGNYLNNLYLVNEFDGKTYPIETEFVPHIKINGEAVNDVTITVPEGADVIQVSGNKVKALKIGKAKVLVSANKDGEEIKQAFNIEVSNIKKTINDKILFSIADGVLPVDEYVSNFNYTKVCQGEEELTVSSDVISGVKSGIYCEYGTSKNYDYEVLTKGNIYTDSDHEPENITVEPIALRFISNGVEVEFANVYAYTKVINNINDLNSLLLDSTNTLFGSHLTGSAEENNLAGYFYLNADIDARTLNLNHDMNSGGFYGVFDGNGHTLKISYTEKGLFGKLGKSCIKNLNLEITQPSETTSGFGIAQTVGAGKWSRRVYFKDMNVLAKDIRTSGIYVVAKDLKVNYDFDNVLFDISLNDGGAKTTPLLAETDTKAVDPKTGEIINKYVNTYAFTESELPLLSNTYNGLEKYLSRGEFAFKNANSLASFDNENWNTDYVIPYWHDIVINQDELFYLAHNSAFVGNSANNQISLCVNEQSNLYLYKSKNVVDATFELVSGGEYLFVSESGTLTGLKKGQAQVRVTYVGRTFTVNADVKNAVTAIDKTSVLFSAYDGDFDLAELLGDEYDDAKNGLIEVTALQEGNSLTIGCENNKILGVTPKISGYDDFDYSKDISTVKVEPVVIQIFTPEKSYEVKLTAYTRVIDDASDLAIFDIATSSTKINGYYILGKDIDASSFTGNTHAGLTLSTPGTSAKEASSFGGVFDGNGYSINNLKASDKGLFGSLNKAIIKNVRINVTSGTAGQNILAGTVSYGSAKNSVKFFDMYVDYSGVAEGVDIQFASRVYWYTVFENMIFKTNVQSASAKQSVIGLNKWSNIQASLDSFINFNNVYVLTSSTCPVGYNADSSIAIYAVGDGSGATDTVKSYPTGLYRFADENAMKDAGKDYSAFNSSVWTINDGSIPQWKK